MSKKLTPGQAVKDFGVTPKTLRQWHREGKIEAEFTTSGHRRYIVPEKEDDIPQSLINAISAIADGKERSFKWIAEYFERLSLEWFFIKGLGDRQKEIVKTSLTALGYDFSWIDGKYLKGQRNPDKETSASFPEIRFRGLTPQQASKLLGVSQNTLRRWHREGRIEAKILEGGHRRYLLDEQTIIQKALEQPTPNEFKPGLELSEEYKKIIAQASILFDDFWTRAAESVILEFLQKSSVEELAEIGLDAERVEELRRELDAKLYPDLD